MNIAGKIVFCLAAAFGLIFGACSLPNSNANTTIAVDEEGTVRETIAEECEEGAFTESELKEYIRRSIADYTSAGGAADAVKMESCEVNGRAVSVVMTFASVDDYSTYNQVPCFLGTLAEAEEAGYDISQDYVDPSGNAGSAETINERRNEWKVFIVSEPVYVRVPDKILYATKNVSVTGRLTAKVLSVVGTADESSASRETGNGTGGVADASSESVNSGSESGTADVSSGVSGSTDDVSAYTTVANEYAYIIYK